MTSVMPLNPIKSAGLYRLRKNPHRASFVTGHDFSHAVSSGKIGWALAPEGKLIPASPFFRSLFSLYINPQDND